MRALQENLQNVQFSMFQKTDEKKNYSRNKNKAYVSYDENERSFNCDEFLIRFNFKKHCDLNRKKHETKNEQIIEKFSFQRICSARLKVKKQHELIREKKALEKLFKKRNVNEKFKKVFAFRQRLMNIIQK